MKILATDPDGPYIEVLLDREVLPFCTEADDEAGYAICEVVENDTLSPEAWRTVQAEDVATGQPVTVALLRGEPLSDSKPWHAWNGYQFTDRTVRVRGAITFRHLP